LANFQDFGFLLVIVFVKLRLIDEIRFVQKWAIGTILVKVDGKKYETSFLNRSVRQTERR